MVVGLHGSSLKALSSARKQAKVARNHRYARLAAAAGAPIGSRMPVVAKLNAPAASENILPKSKDVRRLSPPAIFSIELTST